ncbi:DUF648 domain-containing protein [Candidatus Chlamydia corallus]|uniref:DUF648 domain-containing protein n=1 Tax=Candidatus Chlamydia corallus TaxID=2038470 RepID=UPI000C2FE9DB|nr:DUF648 domain-containing protein [Candidatus Chlamydia corallus]
MNIYSFSHGTCPNLQASLMSKLDSYFCFGGEAVTRIVAISPSGFTLAAQETARVSTIVKILKILSFIFLPIILIALAIRYFLHKKFDRKCFYIPTAMTKQEELLLAANSQLIEKAALEVCPSFFALPTKYQIMKVETLDRTPKITFSVNIDLLLEDLDTDSIEWPKWPLKHGFDFVYCSEERFSYCSQDKALIDQVLKIEENNTTDFLGSESKKLLTRYFLEQLFIFSTTNTFSPYPPKNGRDTFLPYQGKQKLNVMTIWKYLYFYLPILDSEVSEAIKQAGFEIYSRLLRLGLNHIKQYGRKTDQYSTGGPYMATGFLIKWEEEPQSVLRDYGFIS